MTLDVLYQLVNMVMMMAVLFLLRMLYDRLELEVNRPLFIASMGVMLDLIGWFSVSRMSNLESALIGLRISIFGGMLFGLGFIFYMGRMFRAKCTNVVFGFWSIIIIATLVHSFVKNDRAYIMNPTITSVAGLTVLSGQRGLVYFLHIAMTGVIGTWGCIIIIRNLLEKRGRIDNREVANSLFYFSAIILEGISLVVYETNYGQVANFVPIVKAFSTGIYAVLSLKYNILNSGSLAKELLMNDVGAGYIVLSDKYHIIYANDIARKLFPGLEDSFAAGDEIKSIIQKNEYQFSKNGSYYKVTADRIFSNGHLDGYTVLIVDITDVVQLENRAEINEISRRNLLTNISHELRTPLNAITGASEMMKNEGLGADDYKEYAEVIRVGTMSLNDILNDILAASSEYEAKEDDSIAPYSICTLIDNIVEMCNERAVKNKIRFSVMISDDIPINAIGDDGHIRQALVNILSNAIRYTDDGTVSFSIAGEYLNDGRFRYCFTIMDTGKNVFRGGIDEAEEASFDDELGVDYTTGFGISLMVAKRIVQAMGGDLSVHSIPKKGNVYIVHIPSKVLDRKTLAGLNFDKKMTVAFLGDEDSRFTNLQMVCHEMNIGFEHFSTLGRIRKLTTDNSLCNVLVFDYERFARRLAASEKAKDYVRVAVIDSDYKPADYDPDTIFVHSPLSALTLRKVLLEYEERKSAEADADAAFSAPSARILVVDDNSLNLEIARIMIEQFKAAVDVVENGYECLDLLQSGRTYDLIFMDYMMEGMDGIETTQKIRHMASDIKNVPILAFTANAVDGAEEKYIAGGMNGSVFKPANTMAFAAALKKYLPRELLVFEKGKTEEKKSAEVSMFPEIEGIDREAAYRYCGGNCDMYKDMLGTFSKETAGRIEKIREYIEAGDFKDFTVIVHGIKGLSRTLGLTELSERMESMEKAGSREDMEYIRANLTELLSYYTRCGKLLAPYAEEKAREYVNVDGDKIGETLIRMRDYLDDFEMDETEKLFDTIWPAEYDDEKEPLMRGLKESIEGIDYYASKDYIERLLNTYK